MNYRFLSETLALSLPCLWTHCWHHHWCAHGCSQVCPLLSPPQIPSCHSLPHPPTISILAPFEVSLRWLLWSIHIVLARMIWVSEIMRNSKRGANTLLIWVVDSSVDLLHEGLVSNILDQITAFRTCTNNREMANRTLRTIYLVTYLGSHK